MTADVLNDAKPARPGASRPGERTPSMSADPTGRPKLSAMMPRPHRSLLIGGAAAAMLVVVAGYGILGQPSAPHPITVPAKTAAAAPLSAAAALATSGNAAPVAPVMHTVTTVPSKDAQLRELLSYGKGGLGAGVAETGVKPDLGHSAAHAAARAVAAPATPGSTAQTVPAPDAEDAPPVHVQQELLARLTELRDLLADQRKELAGLRSDQRQTNTAIEKKLSDADHHPALTDVKNTLTAAIGSGAGTIAHAASVDKSPKPGDSAASAVPPEKKRYRVQAASPNLAMLAELDRSGDAGAQLQVSIGDEIPGWGKVTTIAQHGTSWVVQTDHGAIQ